MPRLFRSSSITSATSSTASASTYYYYDQFYDAFRNYPAPIFAIPGNHDGWSCRPPARHGTPGDPTSLSAFLANFCTPQLHAQRRRRRHLPHHHDPARRLLHPRGAARAHPRPLLQHAGESRRHLLHQGPHHRQAQLSRALRRAARLTSRRAHARQDRRNSPAPSSSPCIIRPTPSASTSARWSC